MPWPTRPLKGPPEGSYGANETSGHGTPIRLGALAWRRSNWRAKRHASSSLANETALPCPLVPIRPQANSTIEAPNRSRPSATVYRWATLRCRHTASSHMKLPWVRVCMRAGMPQRDRRNPTAILNQSGRTDSRRRLVALATPQWVRLGIWINPSARRTRSLSARQPLMRHFEQEL